MIKPLTSLRFFFAFMIFLFHSNFFVPEGTFFMGIQKSVFTEGYIGVSFFFILSGFILTLNYKAGLTENRISFREFWVARMARIFPLHLFTLLLILPRSLAGLFTDTALWFAQFLTNIFLLQSFVPLGSFIFSFNGSSWSISDELFFYLLFPTIILACFKRPKTKYLSLVLLLLIPVGIFLCPQKLQHSLFYINPLSRIADFIIGILLYELYEQKIISKWLQSKFSATLIEIASIGLLTLFFAFHNYIPQGYRFSCYYWIPMAVIIIVFSYQAGYLSTILSNKVLVSLGEISFSFYLLHFLIIRTFLLINEKFSLTNNGYLSFIIVLTTAIIASCLSYHLIELPANKYIKRKYRAISSIPRY